MEIGETNAFPDPGRVAAAEGPSTTSWSPSPAGGGELAVTVRFELTVRLYTVQRFSKPPPSATRPRHLLEVASIACSSAWRNLAAHGPGAGSLRPKSCSRTFTMPAAQRLTGFSSHVETSDRRSASRAPQGGADGPPLGPAERAWDDRR